MIKVVKRFSFNQNFVPWELSALAPGLYTLYKLCNFEMSSLKRSNFPQMSHGAFCRKVIDNLFEWFHAIEQDGCHADIW